jgi:hypothetical protein
MRGFCSDRPTALYAAKATGRNRMVMAGADEPAAENGEVLDAVGMRSRDDR